MEPGMEIVAHGGIESADRAAIDMQIATAKMYPRAISRFRKEAEALALLDEQTAGECFYALPRSGKTIEGPSARFAEIVLYAWGNARADADIVAEDDTHITAQGTFFDLERNVAIRVRVKRRITDKHGRRYNEDMVGVTSNAGISIALRNAVFKGIPKALWKPIYEKARRASLGEGGTLQQKREQAFEWFRKLGVEPERVLAVLGVGGIEDVKEDELITLRGLANSIKEGETTIEETFPRPGSVDTGANRELNEALQRKAEAQAKLDAEASTAAQPIEEAAAEPAARAAAPDANRRGRHPKSDQQELIDK